MTIQPLGDQAVLAKCADESAAIRLAAAVRSAEPAWLQDVVPAYATVGVFFDAERTTTAEVGSWLRALKLNKRTAHAPRTHTIPVCYEMNLDLPRVAEATGLPAEKVIELHTATQYTVYAIGFVPGFPYLGYLPEPLRGVPRLGTPRVRVDAGSVGLAGKQTGVYPLQRPGGWNIVGRTPRVLVDVAAGFFPLQVGDKVEFVRIDEAEYRRQRGEPL